MTRKAIRRLTTQAARIQSYLGDFLSIARTSKVRRGTATRIVPLVALRAAAHAAHAVVKGLPRLELVGVQGGLDRGDSCHATPQEHTWNMDMNIPKEIMMEQVRKFEDDSCKT